MSSNQVLIIGVLPPPMQGMTAITQAVFNTLHQETNIHLVNLSPKHPVNLFFFRVYKSLKVLYAATQIIRVALRGNISIYMPADAGSGMYFTLLLILVARLCHCPIFLHHHSWAYLLRYDWRMNLINKLMAKQGTHIVLCDQMKNDLKQRYPTAKRLFRLSNAAFFHEEMQFDTQKNRTNHLLRIGHLSNLTMEKGLGLVIETFREALSKNLPIKLILAGQPVSSQEKNLIAAAQQEFGNLLEYRGAVFGNRKLQFYQDIDVFLFPSRYRTESEPLVIIEALSAGVPSIAYDRGCICSYVGKDCGLCIPQQSDFIALAVQQLEFWHKDRVNLQQASENAIKRVQNAHQEALLELVSFVHLLS